MQHSTIFISLHSFNIHAVELRSKQNTELVVMLHVRAHNTSRDIWNSNTNVK